MTSKVPAHELSGLMAWARRVEWRPYLQAVIAEHVEAALEEFGLSGEQLDSTLGDLASSTLWGCAFEDFLTRRFEPDDKNPAEDYLQRRGWKERPPTREYIAALQLSVMSLYEVSDVVPGQSFRARDLIRGGEPVVVSERSATQTLKEWDRIAARLVSSADRTTMGGSVLAFTLEASEKLFAQLRERAGEAGRGWTRANMKQDGALEGYHGSDDDLRRAAPLFTRAWLFDVLSQGLGTEKRTIYNSDGDPIVWHVVNFRLLPGATAEKIRRRLDELEQLRPENPNFWNWAAEQPLKTFGNKPDKAIIWTSTLDDGRIVLGTVELKDRMVSLGANSATRAERGTALLSTALAGLVAAPLTEIQTMEQLQASQHKNTKQEEEPIPPEIKAQIVHETLDRQYRAILDQPVPVLGNVSPRAAARSAGGRKKVAAWLKSLENHSRHLPNQNDPMATYDFSWMWRELNVEDMRN